jgi:hypothetical protein
MSKRRLVTFLYLSSMAIFDSPEGLRAVANVGAALKELGTRLEEVTAVAERSMFAEQEQASGQPNSLPQEREVALLWNRLGRGNRKFLAETAEEFGPGDQFTLPELARRLQADTASLRARLMNLGRSTRSLGHDAPRLLKKDWDDAVGQNIYEWDFDAHRAIQKMAQK